MTPHQHCGVRVRVRARVRVRVRVRVPLRAGSLASGGNRQLSRPPRRNERTQAKEMLRQTLR